MIPDSAFERLLESKRWHKNPQGIWSKQHKNKWGSIITVRTLTPDYTMQTQLFDRKGVPVSRITTKKFTGFYDLACYLNSHDARGHYHNNCAKFKSVSGWQNRV